MEGEKCLGVTLKIQRCFREVGSMFLVSGEVFAAGVKLGLSGLDFGKIGRFWTWGDVGGRRSVFSEEISIAGCEVGKVC